MQQSTTGTSSSTTGASSGNRAARPARAAALVALACYASGISAEVLGWDARVASLIFLAGGAALLVAVNAWLGSLGARRRLVRTAWCGLIGLALLFHVAVLAGLWQYEAAKSAARRGDFDRAAELLGDIAKKRHESGFRVVIPPVVDAAIGRHGVVAAPEASVEYGLAACYSALGRERESSAHRDAAVAARERTGVGAAP